jgi:hypothetical protein
MKKLKNIIYPILAIMWELKKPLKSFVFQVGRIISILIIIIAAGLEMPNLKKRGEKILTFFGGSVEDE